MKILLFIDSLGPGGAQRQLVGLAVMLQEKGYDVKVCTYYDIDFYKSYLDENHVPNVIIPNASSGRQRILAVRKFFKKESPNWVIAYQETPSLVACAVKLLGCNCKLIVSERNTTQHVGMNERVRFFLYHWADFIVPNSFAQEKWLAGHHSWMTHKLMTITNFVDTEKFVPSEHTRREIPEILVAASIWASKNTIGLIKAISVLKGMNIKCHFSWYGKSESNIEYYNQCQELIDKLCVKDYIDLLPKTKEIHRKYQEADYFCLPSFYEGTPNVLCEAISCGLPVMVSDVCDNAIYAQTHINGALFDPNNPEDMAEKIASLLGQNEEQYITYRINSRRIAEEKLSRKTFVEKYIALINR